MTSVVTTDLLNCVIASDNYGSTCLGAVWVPTGQDQTYCWLKYAITDAVTPASPLSCDAATRLSPAAATSAVAAAPIGSSNSGTENDPTCDSTSSIGDGSTWNIQCDVDYPETDITDTSAPDLYSCIQACDDYGIACVGVVWDNDFGSGSGTCYLKNSLSSYTNDGYNGGTPDFYAVARLSDGSSVATTTSIAASATTSADAPPTVALASPTAIAGDLDGSPDSYDDVVYLSASTGKLALLYKSARMA